MYLADLGLNTNPDGFYALSQDGLHVLPGTVLVEKRIEGGGTRPILVVAKPTVDHPGTILLRFNAIPTECKRTNEDLEPFWIPVQPSSGDLNRQNDAAVPPTTTPEEENVSEDEEGPVGQNQLYVESNSEVGKIPVPESTVRDTHLRISHKGIVERKLSNGEHIPVYGNAFWFAYSLLGTCARYSKQNCTGQLFGLQIRLETLYIARECVLPNNISVLGWFSFLRRCLDPTKIPLIPIEWSEDSPDREDKRLTRRFETSISDELRTRSRFYRERRQAAFKAVQERHEHHSAPLYLPLEALKVTTSLWRRELAELGKLSYVFGLPTTRTPTSPEICVAAASNADLADQIASVLRDIHDKFKKGNSSAPDVSIVCDIPQGKVVLLCAVIIMQSIADNSPYLAALIDVQTSVTKWNPAYLC